MSKHPSSTILNETYAEFSRQSPKEFQRKLYEHYEKCKVEFFPDTALPTPIIELTPPSSAKAWGEFLPQSQSGIESKINLRPTILTGEHPKVSGLEEHAFGRQLLMYDILVQQMLRMFCVEVLKEPENSFHGHGPRFRDECNSVGQILGLSQVRTGKKRGRDKELPSCANWPYIVRPEGYFQGAWPLLTSRRTKVIHQSIQQQPLPEDEKNNPNFYIPEAYHKWMKNLVELFGADEALKVIFYGGKEVSHSDKDRFVEVRSDLRSRLSEIENLIVNQKEEFESANAPVDAFMKT